MKDSELLNRALLILHRMRIEHTGWRRWFERWYYSDEPLRNDADNLLHEIEFNAARPVGTKYINE